MLVRRGDIFYADLGPTVGSEQGGVRPVLIIQNNKGNEYSPTVICAAISTRKRNKYLPTHVLIDAKNHELMRDSVVLLEQVRTIDKQRLVNKIGHLSKYEMQRVNKSLCISMGIYNGKRTLQRLPR